MPFKEHTNYPAAALNCLLPALQTTSRCAWTTPHRCVSCTPTETCCPHARRKRWRMPPSSSACWRCGSSGCTGHCTACPACRYVPNGVLTPSASMACLRLSLSACEWACAEACMLHVRMHTCRHHTLARACLQALGAKALRVWVW